MASSLQQELLGKSPLPTDKYFSESYVEARQKFRDACDALKSSISASVSVIPVLVKEPDYTMDICIVKGSGSRGLLVHSSGVHGVEGYAGSAIQIAALHQMACSGQIPEVTCVFVHAVNPYGMAHFRRWNENNVDLNRNALDEDGWKEVKARDPNIAGYEDFKSLLVPVAAPSSFFFYVGIWLQLLFLIARFGTRHMKRCFVTATYHHDNGVFFGGKELQPSHVLLTKFLKEHFGSVPGSEVYWVDVHTGLGPKGVDVLLCGGKDLKVAREKFPGADVQAAEDEGNADSSQAAGYELVRGFVKGYYDKVFNMSAGKAAVVVTQEFGTLSPINMARNMIIENRGYHFDRPNHEHWRTYTRDAFYCREPAWKENVVKRGKIVFDQLLNLVVEKSKL